MKVPTESIVELARKSMNDYNVGVRDMNDSRCPSCGETFNCNTMSGMADYHDHPRTCSQLQADAFTAEAERINA